ncbi:hypothetical protein KIN20_019883 [Parelaphostrongylus tenuis]|uniref:Uncharacterized protein n=1 Tax=Parelaphostrongylus tenuis TaxID=148309 RepID=A0AAD5QQG7_PARTN|nr:hypothetical protein KIN20_019876 [Parelaphostrongylus tenuis]KAJ1360808.1 hypothetical protein KIN20_019883 [Parelaphostrongylus tenuis]
MYVRARTQYVRGGLVDLSGACRLAVHWAEGLRADQQVVISLLGQYRGRGMLRSSNNRTNHPEAGDRGRRTCGTHKGTEWECVTAYFEKGVANESQREEHDARSRTRPRMEAETSSEKWQCEQAELDKKILPLTCG